MKQGLLEGLNSKQIEKLNKCHTSEEILALAKEEGIELTNEQLEAVNGGACEPDGNINFPNKCPKCGGTNTKFTGEHYMGRIIWDSYECLDCKREYRVVKSSY